MTDPLRDPLKASVDVEGRLVLPPEVASRLGLTPGTSVTLDEEPNSVRVRRPVEQLAKVYVEPTNRCNLTCRTCMRNSWEEPQGDMGDDTFDRFLRGLKEFDPLPTVFFGGFGEPLAHPRILDMVEQVKALEGSRVELITNGCLLDEETSRRLVDAGLDTLWVSLDGIKPESYSDVRLGALLPDVLSNLRTFKEIRTRVYAAGLSSDDFERYETARIWGWYDPRLPPAVPRLGIAFVAMRRNISDLPAVLSEGHKLGASRFLVTNVLPYTKDLAAEILYGDLLGLTALPTFWHHSIRLPPMQVNEATKGPLWSATCGYDFVLAESDVSGVTRCCPFIDAGSAAVTWRGEICPCLALMHTHTEFFNGLERRIHKYVVGDLEQHDLGRIWREPDYVALRRKIQDFDFSPCVACGGCSLTETNEEDCLGNELPSCGACLWSHGLIRCP